ncbi:MAG: hypothetical protein COV67_07315 [Nitrospinae bacterium CG11_big_fil_rev_8_21_14_0_20_56_8]|nr:MAG: hypothetical protein COV67_07315 [Nitrospinae bacterium CG11_big_fil_rev_8_21_14_0_20_56_8]
MTDSEEDGIFITPPVQGLPLLDETGRGFWGLQRSSSPELADRVRSLFEYLNGAMGFPDTARGREDRECFNLLVRSVYPEILIDLADRIYVQHERPAVFLHFDHINLNLRRDNSQRPALFASLNRRMEVLFDAFTDALRTCGNLAGDAEVVRCLSEGYSHYLFRTKNFPWEEPLQNFPPEMSLPVLDVATGLSGFNLLHDWPALYPRLILTDNMPFIVRGLAHFKNLLGRENVEVRYGDFSNGGPAGEKVGCLRVQKFLHHLKRPERQRFLQWALGILEPGGQLRVLDTDLELSILHLAGDPQVRSRLIRGYPETLVEIENEFCGNVVKDIQAAGFRLTHLDFHEYLDETDAYSRNPRDNLPLKFIGIEVEGMRES